MIKWETSGSGKRKDERDKRGGEETGKRGKNGRKYCLSGLKSWVRHLQWRIAKGEGAPPRAALALRR